MDLGRVQEFIRCVGRFEDEIFQKRMKMLQRQKERNDRNKVLLHLVAYYSRGRGRKPHTNLVQKLLGTPQRGREVSWVGSG